MSLFKDWYFIAGFFIARSNKGKSGNKMEDEESEGLALLIPDIQETALLVALATHKLKENSGNFFSPH